MPDDNKNGDGDSQKNTSRNDQASLDCVEERPEQPEPEQLATGNGKYCFRFQCSDNNYVRAKAVAQLVEFVATTHKSTTLAPSTQEEGTGML